MGKVNHNALEKKRVHKEPHTIAMALRAARGEPRPEDIVLAQIAEPEQKKTFCWWPPTKMVVERKAHTECIIKTRSRRYSIEVYLDRSYFVKGDPSAQEKSTCFHSMEEMMQKLLKKHPAKA